MPELAQYDIYAPPNPCSEDRMAQVLLPVSQILPLVEQFPEAFLQAVMQGTWTTHAAFPVGT